MGGKVTELETVKIDLDIPGSVGSAKLEAVIEAFLLTLCAVTQIPVIDQCVGYFPSSVFHKAEVSKCLRHQCHSQVKECL